LDGLKALGVTALELMPVAQFPGSRNWGYDGVYPFAVQHSYGGPEGLKRLVKACHERDLAVVLDVVYNHIGPEGNYLESYGPYFTDRYRTPWGKALNFDGPESEAVREFFIQMKLTRQLGELCKGLSVFPFILKKIVYINNVLALRYPLLAGKNLTFGAALGKQYPGVFFCPFLSI